MAHSTLWWLNLVSSMLTNPTPVLVSVEILFTFHIRISKSRDRLLGVNHEIAPINFLDLIFKCNTLITFYPQFVEIPYLSKKKKIVETPL